MDTTRDGRTDARVLDVLVVGGGQAGLATGYHLRATGFRYEIVEGHARLGESWRRRYDSLTLFTPRAYSALPGLPVPGDPDGYPTKDEIADYLESTRDTSVCPSGSTPESGRWSVPARRSERR